MATAMKQSWSANRVLALAALVLGVVAVAGNPYRGHRVSVDTKELATIVGGEVDHVSPRELADWIIRGETGYRLVDLRSPDAYAEYHIPTAENAPIAGLPDYGLGRNERIVLYSDGGIHSAQGWFLLKASGYAGAYILSGGLDAWKDEVLYPVSPSNPTPEEAARFERVVQISRFFGGGPRAALADTSRAPRLAGDAGAPGVPAPGNAALAPPPPRPATTATPKKRKKEGC